MAICISVGISQGFNLSNSRPARIAASNSPLAIDFFSFAFVAHSLERREVAPFAFVVILFLQILEKRLDVGAIPGIAGNARREHFGGVVAIASLRLLALVEAFLQPPPLLGRTPACVGPAWGVCLVGFRRPWARSKYRLEIYRRHRRRASGCRALASSAYLYQAILA